MCEDIAIAGAWAATSKSRELVGGGGLLSEFGAVGEDPVSIEFINAGLDQADKRLQGWAYWTYKSFDDITTTGDPLGESLFHSDGSIQMAKLRALTRTFAPQVAGSPIFTRFDNSTGDEVFSLEYTSTGSGSTVMYVNEELHYQDGVDVSIEPASAASWIPGLAPSTIEIISNGTEANITVIVKRKITCKCAEGSTNVDGCCTKCKKPQKSCGGNAGLAGTGNWCGNDFHAVYCSAELPMCCTSRTGAAVCCSDGSSCATGDPRRDLQCVDPPVHAFVY